MEVLADELPAIVDGMVAEPAAPINQMDIALQWIGFDNVATRNRLRDEGFSTFK
jgi:hypothetical protein